MRIIGRSCLLLLMGITTVARAAPGDLTADSVLGQPGFTQLDPNQPSGAPTASNLSPSNASHVAIGPSGRIYVSDAFNNRILSWPSAAGFTIGQAADLVIGQPDFVSGAPNNGGVSGSGLNLPQGLWVDAAGNLWVTDAFNHRVLKFNNPLSDATPTTADLVIGQVNLNSNLENLGQGGSGPDVALPDSLQFPGRVIALGAEVWVADSGNSRVLHYSNVTANKPVADRVFGQYGNFFKRAKNNNGSGQNGFTASADNLLNPIGIAVDAAGSLYIADWANHRILRYDNPVLGDMTADAVFGQPDFVSNTLDDGGPANGLQLPIDLAIDSVGRLFVADSGNNRLLVYSQPTFSIAPDGVFGQFANVSGESPNHGLAACAGICDSGVRQPCCRLCLAACAAHLRFWSAAAMLPPLPGGLCSDARYAQSVAVQLQRSPRAAALEVVKGHLASNCDYRFARHPPHSSRRRSGGAHSWEHGPCWADAAGWGRARRGAEDRLEG